MITTDIFNKDGIVTRTTVIELTAQQYLNEQAQKQKTADLLKKESDKAQKELEGREKIVEQVQACVDEAKEEAQSLEIDN